MKIVEKHLLKATKNKKRNYQLFIQWHSPQWSSFLKDKNFSTKLLLQNGGCLVPGPFIYIEF